MRATGGHPRAMMWVAIVASVCLLVGMGRLLFILVVQPNVPQLAEQPLPTRDEFRKQVMGATQSEVLEAFGSPKRTTESGRAKYWSYRGITRDGTTGRKDSEALVIFRDGRVTAVNFN